MVLAPVAVEGVGAVGGARRDPSVTVEPLPSFDPSRRSAGWTLDGTWCPPSGFSTGPPPSRSASGPCWWPRPRRSGGPGGASTAPPSTPAPASSSGGPSASSRGSSTGWPTCWPRWSRRWPPPGTPPWWSTPERLDRPRIRPAPRAGWRCPLAATLALDGYVEAAKGAIQVLGGMGFTWEHDAHIHLRRATTLRQLVGGTAPLRAEAARLALDGGRRSIAVDLPAEAEALRRGAGAGGGRHRRHRGPGRAAPCPRRPGAAGPALAGTLGAGRRCRRAAGDRPGSAPRPGSDGPTWPWRPGPCRPSSPTGRRNSPSGGWPRPCGARSSGASCSASRGRDPTWPRSPPGPPGSTGGWSLTGQKVWTSVAARADMGICLARTNPDVPKHRGITYFLVDMQIARHRGAAPARDHRRSAVQRGLLRRVLRARRLRGRRGGRRMEAGPHHAGQRAGLAVVGLGLRRRPRGGARAAGRPPRAARTRSPWTGSGDLLAEAQSLAQLGVRATLRSLGGLQPGSESSLRKLLGAEFEQRVHEFGLDLCGPDGAVTDGEAAVSGSRHAAEQVPDHRRWDQRGAAQRDRRAPARAAPGPRAGAVTDRPATARSGGRGLVDGTQVVDEPSDGGRIDG